MQTMYFKNVSKRFGHLSMTIAACLLLWGCSAVSVLAPVENTASNGVVRFYQGGNSLKIQVYLKNLSPLTAYTLRIHQVGDCRDPLKGSIGEPFDHTTYNFQKEPIETKQIGNLGDVTADENGSIEFHFTVLGSKLTGPRKDSILGRSLILTAKGQAETASAASAWGLISKNATL